MGVTLAFVILALLEATLPKTNVQALSRSEMMGLEAHLLDNDGDDLLGASLRSGSPGGGSFSGPSKSLIVGGEQQHSEKLPPSPVNNGSIVATTPIGQQPRLVLPTAAPPPPPLPHQQQQSVPSAAQQQNQPQLKRSAADIDDPIRFADDDEDDGVELNAML